MVNTGVFLGAGFWQQRQEDGAVGRGGVGGCGSAMGASGGCWAGRGLRTGLCCTNCTAGPAQQLDECEITDAALSEPEPLGWS